MTHDYKRNGVTTLFAALNVLDGSVISCCQSRHRHTEWLKFLRQIDKCVEPGLQIHVVLDNYATHKHAKVRQWLARHPRFHMHFTATSASWMNMVERFFRSLSEDTGSSAVSSKAWASSSPLLTSMSPPTTSIPSRLSGPRRLAISCKKSSAQGKN